MGVLEVEVEFKEDEHVVLSVLEVEVEFKEEEKEEQVIWGVGGRGGVQGGRGGRTGDLGVLEVEVEFKEDEHVVLRMCWRSRWSSRRKRRKNR